MVISGILIGLVVIMVLLQNFDPGKIAADILKRDDMEGFWPHKKWDYKQYSIGHGTRWVEGDKTPITRLEAYSILRERITIEYQPFVTQRLNAGGISLNPQQQAALISFVFNVGPKGMKLNTWWGQYLQGNMPQARHRFLQWNKAEVDGVLVPLHNLTDRRKKEWYWLVKGVYNPAAVNMTENQLPLN